MYVGNIPGVYQFSEVLKRQNQGLIKILILINEFWNSYFNFF